MKIDATVRFGAEEVNVKGWLSTASHGFAPYIDFTSVHYKEVDILPLLKVLNDGLDILGEIEADILAKI